MKHQASTHTSYSALSLGGLRGAVIRRTTAALSLRRSTLPTPTPAHALTAQSEESRRVDDRDPGVRRELVQARLAHSSASFTMQVYSHVTPGMDAEAAQKAADRVFRRIGRR